MKRRNRTLEEVQEMIKLRKEGMSLLKIAKRFGCDHTTIIYWIRKVERDGEIKIYKGSKQIPLKLLRKVKRKTKNELEKEKQRKIKKGDICKVCLNPKTDPKWKDTNYCGLTCWDKGNAKHRTRTEREFD